ncbi:hypothetical protein BDR03DRAFT_942871 [Suillus americanus]|nr:hypothetical protein BDR03DRAFT_942871 [Suillus americanus]
MALHFGGAAPLPGARAVVTCRLFVKSLSSLGRPSLRDEGTKASDTTVGTFKLSGHRLNESSENSRNRSDTTCNGFS